MSGSYGFVLKNSASASCTYSGTVVVDNFTSTFQPDFSYVSTALDSIGLQHSVAFENLTPNTANVLWNFGDGTISTELHPVHSFEYGTHSISLEVTDTYGCKKTITKVIVLRLLVACELVMPNAFSPNNDNINDELGILGYAPKVELKIFNRWGEVIFRTTEIPEKWNGAYREIEVPGGVYPYILEYECKDENGLFSKQNKVGQITLVR